MLAQNLTPCAGFALWKPPTLRASSGRSGLTRPSVPTWTRASRSLSRLKASFSALGSADHDADEELPFVEDDDLRLRVACALVIDAQHGWPAAPQH